MGEFSLWNRSNLHHEFVEFYVWNREGSKVDTAEANLQPEFRKFLFGYQEVVVVPEN